ncbi:hypothetical protein [Nocardia sp. NPDC019395]|uniref:hypothetical protein n=1 Tax=Nocardia sp. NPDC019395 TaxID=3154686 RepID=UPI0033C0A5D5
MAKRIEVDPALLGDAAKLVAEIGDNLAAVRDKADRILFDTEIACGSDQFGEEFAGGSRGFRSQGEAAGDKAGRMSEIVAGIADDMGVGNGAARAHIDTDESSSKRFG